MLCLDKKHSGMDPPLVKIEMSIQIQLNFREFIYRSSFVLLKFKNIFRREIDLFTTAFYACVIVLKLVINKHRLY
jgi:hypothetical protein